MKFLPKIVKGSWLVAALVVLVVGATHVSAASTDGIGGRPAMPDPDNPRTESIFIHTLNRGEKADDAVLLMNNSDTQRTVEIYAVDGVVTNTGAYTCRQKAEPLSRGGSWIKLSKNEVVMEPKTKLEVPFTITVPNNADVGEHNACLVFADKNQEGVTSGNVRIQTRQAVRAVITIPGDLHREITLTDFSSSANNRTLQFSVELQNKGNVSADVDVRVAMDSLFGSTKYTNGGVYPVLSNEKLNLNYTESEKVPFWGGWYKMSAEARYNKDLSRLGFDSKADTLKTERFSKTVFIAPSTGAIAIIVGIIVIAAGVVVYVQFKRRADLKRQTDWVVYEVQEGDTLEALSLDRGVNWALVAKTNKLKPPYSLTAGGSIKLPSKQTTDEKTI